MLSIEGNPFIIRFKTTCDKRTPEIIYSIEGNPFIIRFKTNSFLVISFYYPLTHVLKVIHL